MTSARVLSISDARAQLPQLAEEVHWTGARFIVTVSGKPRMAWVSLADLEAIEALGQKPTKATKKAKRPRET